MNAGMQFDSRQMDIASGAYVEHKVPITVAKNEIVKVYHIVLFIEMAAAGNSFRSYFSLKTAKGDNVAPPEADENLLLSDKHTFWRPAYRIDAGFLRTTWSEEIYFDPPLILIREPRIISKSPSQVVYLNAFWCYTKEKISEAELTRFMVKKHY